jgi:HPt (histidine-containing phosphotransfer) domain-containing protein
MNMDNIDIYELDESMLAEVKDLLKDRFSSIAEVYVEDSVRYIDNINQGVLQKNRQMIGDSAHPLKSSSYSFGFMGVGKLSEFIEHAARDSNDESAIDHIAEVLPELNSAFEIACAKLKGFLSRSR